jgi:hypothetical protein
MLAAMRHSAAAILALAFALARGDARADPVSADPRTAIEPLARSLIDGEYCAGLVVALIPGIGIAADPGVGRDGARAEDHRGDCGLANSHAILTADGLFPVSRATTHTASRIFPCARGFLHFMCTLATTVATLVPSERNRGLVSSPRLRNLMTRLHT